MNCSVWFEVAFTEHVWLFLYDTMYNASQAINYDTDYEWLWVEAGFLRCGFGIEVNLKTLIIDAACKCRPILWTHLTKSRITVILKEIQQCI